MITENEKLELKKAKYYNFLATVFICALCFYLFFISMLCYIIFTDAKSIKLFEIHCIIGILAPLFIMILCRAAFNDANRNVFNKPEN